MLRALNINGRLLDGGIDFIEASWNRKWSQPGEFMIYMTLEEYNRLNALKMKYIENTGRPETGVIQKVEYSKETEGAFATVSGLFAQKLLNFGSYRKNRTLEAATSEAVKSAMASYVVSANAPVTISGHNYKPIGAVYFDEASVYPSELDISIDSDTQMGQALYNCLEDTGYSFDARISKYPLIDNTGDMQIMLKFRQGRQLTEGETGVFFGKAYNNVDNMKYILDESNEICVYEILQDVEADVYSSFSSSYFPIKFTEKENGELRYYIGCTYYASANRPTGVGASYPKRILTTSLSSDECDLKNTTSANQRKIRALMQKQARLDMLDHYKVETIELSIIPGRYEYMVDYDLGDTCVALIDDMEQVFHARIEEVNETHKENRVDIELVLGTPVKQKWR